MAARSPGEKGRSLKGGSVGQSAKARRKTGKRGLQSRPSPGENGRSLKGGSVGRPIGQSAPQNRQNGAIAKRRKCGRAGVSGPQNRQNARPGGPVLGQKRAIAVIRNGPTQQSAPQNRQNGRPGAQFTREKGRSPAIGGLFRALSHSGAGGRSAASMQAARGRSPKSDRLSAACAWAKLVKKNPPVDEKH